MPINIELSFFQLKRLETALAVFSYKQKHERGIINDEILGQELKYFLDECPNILGLKENRRKNIRDIIGWIGGQRNLEKGSWSHKIIQEVLAELLKN